MLSPVVAMNFSEPAYSHSWKVQKVEGEYVSFCKDCGEIANHSVNTEKAE
jgi:hypothetical protein